MLLASVNTAWAQDYVAQNEATNENYTTLQEAVDKVQNNQTIRLLNDVIISKKIKMKSGISYTINFGGNHGIFWGGEPGDPQIDTATEYKNGQAALDFVGGGQVTLTEFMINGVAYPIFVEEGVTGLTVNINGITTGPTTSARALIYSKGNGNTFTINHVDLFGRNNEKSLSEDFACLVDEGSNNSFVVNGGFFSGKVKYPISETNNATERLVDFRGTNSTLLLKGGFRYSCNPADQGGLLTDPTTIIGTASNMIYFDDAAKTSTYIAPLVEAIAELEFTDEKVDFAGSQYYALKGTARIDVTNTAEEPETETYTTMEDAFASTLFGDGSIITLQTNAILAGNITPAINSGESFNIVSNDFVVNPDIYKILLNAGASADYDGTNGPALFGAIDPNTTILQDGTTYTAGNVYENEYETYGLLEDVMGFLDTDQQIVLQTNIALTNNIVCALEDGQNYTLSCGNYTLSSNGGKITLADGAKIISDKSLADVLVAATEGSTITITMDGSNYVHTATAAMTDAEAQIGTAKFATLEEAIAVVTEGQTIELLKNVVRDTPIEINKGGFTIDGRGEDGKNDTIKCSAVTNVETEYLNNKGALFFTGGTGEVVVKNLSIMGFAYAIDVEANDINVNMNGGKVFGRAALNVHGNNNQFTFTGVEIHGMNNESQSASEAFAAFVLDNDADANTLNIVDCPVIATVANNNGYNTEKLIELRGKNNLVFISGQNSTYECTPAIIGGFTNDLEDLTNDNVYFNEAAKAKLSSLFDNPGTIHISDIESADYEGFYPLTSTTALVIVDDTYRFSSIEKAFASENFNPATSTIKLLGPVTLAQDFTPNMTNGDMFIINLNGKTLNGGGHHINLVPGAVVEVKGGNNGANEAAKAVFAAIDEKTVIVASNDVDNVGIDYTAANCVFNGTPTMFYESVVDPTNGELENNKTVELATDIAMTSDLDLSSFIGNGQSFTLIFGNNNFTGGKNILLADGSSVNTDKQTEIFKPATNDHFIIETKNGENSYTYSVSATAPATGLVLNETKGVYYTTLQAATAAADANDVIKLLDDITINKNDQPVNITKPMTIYSDGKTLRSNVAYVNDEYVDEYVDMMPAFNFTGITEPTTVEIRGINIKGFAYAANIEHSVKNLTLNMNGIINTDDTLTISGRAVINNWGSNNTFNVEGYKVNGLNNETGNFQNFATFVDNEGAKDNAYNIKGFNVEAKVADTASDAATEKFIDLRGTGAKVKLLGNTKYEYTSSKSNGGGFTNDDYINLLVSENRVWFDESSKDNFKGMFDAYPTIDIAESTDYSSLYPLILNAEVVVINDTYRFTTIEKAFESEYFDPTTYPTIKLLADVTLAKDFTPNMANGDMFTIDLNGKTLNGNGNHINLARGAVVEVVGGATDATKELFAAVDPTTNIVATDAIDETSGTPEVYGVDYSAANCIIDDFPTLFYETVVDESDSPDDDDDDPDGALANGSIIDLVADIAMTDNLDLSIFIKENESFTLNFGNYNFTGGKNMLLADGTSVNTDKQTDLFKAANANSYVLETKNGENSYTYSVSATVPADGLVLNETKGICYPTLQIATAAADANDVIKLLADITIDQNDEQVNINKPLTIYGDGVKLKTNATEGNYDNGRGAFNFTGITEPTAVNINGINIIGFAYAAHIEPGVQNLTLTMKGNNNTEKPDTITGRAVINNSGSNNTFNVEGYVVNGLNNEDGNYEYFATFVDYEEAKDNAYNIKDFKVKAKVDAGASDAATEKFIDLRGSDAKVKIYNTTYEYTGDIDGRGGFTNDDYVNMLVSNNNKVWFDGDAKTNFSTLFDVYPTLSIAEDADETTLYPLIVAGNVVRLIPETNTLPAQEYFFNSLEEAIASSYFKPGAEIDLLGNVTVTKDITLPATFIAKNEDTNNFTLNLIDDDEVKHTIAIEEGKGITLNPLIYVTVMGGADGAVDKLFKVSDANTVICTEVFDTDKTYMAANAKYMAGGDPETGEYNLFEEIFNEQVDTDEDDILDSYLLGNGDAIQLMADVTLQQNIDLTGRIGDGDEMTINFDGKNISNGTIAIPGGASVNTDKKTDIFTVTDENYLIAENKTSTGYTYTSILKDDAVAKIGNTLYATLQQAVDAVQAGETIELLKKDIFTATPVEINKGGFTIEGNNDTIRCSAFANAKEEYLNSKGALFFTGGTGTVAIKNLSILGYAYAIDVEGTGINVTMDGGEIYGRAALNVHGNGNKFAFTGVKVNGMNNQTQEGAEAFAAFVLDTDADNNELSIENCEVIATIAHANGYNTEKFIELRGKDNLVFISGAENSYTCDPENQGGFTNNFDDLLNDKVYFKENAKATFAPMFETDTDLRISDVESADYEDYYPLITTTALVILDDNYRFPTIEKAFESEHFNPATSTIKLLGPVTLAQDFTPNMTNGDQFYINLNGKTLSSGGHHINLAPGAVVEIMGGKNNKNDGYEDLFAVTDEKTTIVAVETENEIGGVTIPCVDYTAANCVADGFATLFNETVIGEGMIADGIEITLKKDVTMTGDVDLTDNFKDEDQNPISGSFKLNFEGNNLTGGNIKLPVDVSVTTDKQTDIFKAVNDQYYVLETDNGNNTYTYRVSANLPADGVVRNENTNIIYPTLQAATAAANEGNVLTILQDITTDKKVNITKSMTIQGNGHVVASGETPYDNDLWLFNLTDIAEGAEVNIENVNINGFAYAVNVENSVKGVKVGMTSTNGDNTITGRAAINNWGSDNTFNVDGYEIHALNNEDGNYEKFAAFVDNKSLPEAENQYEAKNNTYNISKVKVIATVDANASDAATSKFIDLRGSGAKVNIYNTTYEYTGNIDSRGGFTNDDYVNLLVSSNKVWFDENAKSNFAALIGVYDGLSIAENADETDLWPLININGVVRLTPDLAASDVYYHFNSLEEAIASSYFKPGAKIDLLSNITVTEDITLPATFIAKNEDTNNFTLNLVEEINDNPVTYTITVEEGKGIILNPLIYVTVMGGADGAVDGLFKVSDENTVICTEVDGTDKTYTAANAKYMAGSDPDYAEYNLFEDIFQDKIDTDGDGTPDSNLLCNGDAIQLMKDITLQQNINLTGLIGESEGEEITINFDGNSITGGTIAIPDLASVNTDEQTLIFVPATDGHFVLETANADGTYTYSIMTSAPGDAVARIDNRYFSTLQGATNVAKDGETVVLLKTIEIADPVNITTAITLEGDDHKVTSTANPAFTVSGTGDVTINKLKVTATEGAAIEVNNEYAGKLTLNNDSIKASSRGIDVQSIAEGFALTVNSSAIQGNVTNPKTEYINMMSAIHFGNDAVPAKVDLNYSTLQGFAYGVNVADMSGNLEVNLNNGSFYGRAVVNNWGNGSTFNIDNMAVNGLNNEPSHDSATDYEKFATIVDNNTEGQGEANYNNYNINNTTFTANADAATANAATEMFIDLRGNSARVKITGNTTYTYTGNETGLGGFTNVDYFENLYNNNNVWFDETAKAFFKPLVETFVDAAGQSVTILDELDPDVNLYPIGTFNAAVVMHVFDENGKETKYYFEDLNSALTSPQFGADVQIDLLKDMDLTTTDEDNQPVAKEYTIDVPFTLNLNVMTAGADTPEDDTDDVFTPVTLTGVKFNLVPANSVTVKGGSTATDGLFAVADDYVLYAGIIKDIRNGETDPTYYAGNVYYSGIDTYTYFDFLFDEDRDEVLEDEGYIRVEKPFMLDKSLVVSEDVNTFYLDVDDDRFIIRDGNSIVLRPFPETYAQDGPEVYVTEAVEDLFSSADPEYTVMVDNLTDPLVKDGVTYTKKYYLMKDGLSVTVAPATYCSHKQTPTVTVKKRVEKEDEPGEYEWVTLTESINGTNGDYKVTLVPNEEEDAYVDAKTYANSIIVEGITFQGRRKADFIINPREISDVTVTGNEQPSRDNGYTRELIANAIAAEYGCIITEHKKDATTVMTYTLKKKGATTEKPDYVVTVDLAEGQRIYEIGTYKDLITVAALEGTEGTQNFVGSRKLDFVILPGDAIDIANVLITSKAVYNSLTQIPSYESIEVTYKNGYNKVVLDPKQFNIEIHGMQHDYVDAKTYTNAITLKGTGKVGTTNSLKFYGSINADYVIAPRDLADSIFTDDMVQVVLEKNKDMEWTGEDLTNKIKIGDISAANNLFLYMKVQKGDTYNDYRYALQNKDADDVNNTPAIYDYSYTVEPSPMTDPGEYKVIFTGRGNFTGMREVKIAVLKSIEEAEADFALQVIPGVNETNYNGNDATGLAVADLQGIVVKDGNKTLEEGVHYTVTVKDGDATVNPIKQEGIYDVVIEGKYPYYNDNITGKLDAVYEYYTYDANNVDGGKYGIHVTSGADKTASVGTLEGIAVKANADRITLDGKKTVTLTKGDLTHPVELTINSIDDNAFGDNDHKSNLHYVDATALDGYEPTTLSRTEDGPFNGIRKQAIVYLDGDDVYGENYVYETSAGDYRCDEFKIYDDYEGDQQGFDNGDYSWHIVNKYEFTAATLTNTRMFLKDENHDWHYTTCLPYDLPLADKMKAYTLTAASDNMFGFREIEGDAIMAFTPYVIIPSVAGNLLSTTNAIVKVTPENNRAFMPLDSNGNQQTDEIAHHGYVLYGSNMYLGASSTNPDTEGLYIMQRDKQWKKIPAGDAGAMWNKACVLPMRAYIMKISETGGSREIMGSKFIDGVKEMATDMVGDDWSNAEVYDMQGRKVDTTKSSMRKGVYIVNGQKRIRK